MGFLFGLFLGAAASGGASPPILGSIPFRCLSAFEVSDAEYRVCRVNTLRRELYEGTPCRVGDINEPTGPCSYEKAITWEIAGLHALKNAMEAKQSPVAR